jgi:branched-chain amino acid transport system substrate-binding protein
LLQERAKLDGFELQLLPVTAPGTEQKATWLQIRQSKPDYVFLWGWGVMNSTALKEAQATGYPRDKMYGVWWAGAEPDVKDIGEGAKGYNALALNPAGTQPKVIQDIMKYVYDKGQGSAASKDEVGTILYTRGVIIQMLGVEAVRRAQERFGKGKVMTSEQVRWGLENLALDQKKLDALGFSGVMRPISTSCQDHMGSTWARIETWDGAKWNVAPEWYQADEQIIKPMVKTAGEKYEAEKKLSKRDVADCSS